MIRQFQLRPPALRRKDVIVVIAPLSLILKWQSKYQLVSTLKSLNWIQLYCSKKPTLITPDYLWLRMNLNLLLMSLGHRRHQLNTGRSANKPKASMSNDSGTPPPDLSDLDESPMQPKLQ